MVNIRIQEGSAFINRIPWAANLSMKSHTRSQRSVWRIAWLVMVALLLVRLLHAPQSIFHKTSSAASQDSEPTTLGFLWPGRIYYKASQRHPQDRRGLELTDSKLKFLGMPRRPGEHKTQTRVGGASLAARLGFGAALLGLLNVGFLRVKQWFETPSRPYGASNSVGDEYDKWTREGVLEHYWGEHIHMGSYTPMSRQWGYNAKDPFLIALLRATLFPLKNFKEAKIDFTNEMIAFSKSTSPQKILDVGCGIGGTSRMLARKFPDAEITGITLSPEQVARATSLAKEAGLTNANFKVMNALEMTFSDNTFDLVWGCESGEHMPDKKKYIEEMVRVLKPQGKLAVATWCERDPTPPFSNAERKALEFVYAEWCHPHFISLGKYEEHLRGTGALAEVETQDWTEQTLPSWRHSVWVGAWSPLYWIKISLRWPRSFLTFLREIYTLEQYHLGMRDGLLVYGMMRATKK